MNNPCYCTCCGKEMRNGEVCSKCIHKYGNEDLAPEKFCNECGRSVESTGGLCDDCLQ